MEAIDADHDGLTLYRHVACPYCERVVRLAAELDVDFRSRFVVPQHSKRGYVKLVSGTRSVPVLVDPDAGIVIAESANIVEYLESAYGGSA